MVFLIIQEQRKTSARNISKLWIIAVLFTNPISLESSVFVNQSFLRNQILIFNDLIEMIP